MAEQQIIALKNAVARNPLVRLVAPVNVAFGADEQIAVYGPNGAGKSLLIDMLTGKSPLREGRVVYDFCPSASTSVYENIRYIAFRDTYGSADINYYYQQRWNAHDQDEAPTVRQQLGEVRDEAYRHRLFTLLGIESLLDKKIILLSSGELRKFQLAKALLARPRVLILDNPYIGLDAGSRGLLTGLLERIVSMSSLQLVLVTSMPDDVPPFVTHVVPVDACVVGRKLTRTEWEKGLAHRRDENRAWEQALRETLCGKIGGLPCVDSALSTPSEVVRMNGVTIRYGTRVILQNLDWTVMRGEKWALTGANGSGKSTLLSLVCADNPQSYACDIHLFGRKRGTGESVWDIKRRIGYVSPEMHRAYLKNLPTIEIVASGLHDSIGLYHRLKTEDAAICEWWMDIFGIASLRDKPFLQLSSGEQRLALLARAFVKDPELLILDEPLHGLDVDNRCRVRNVIDVFCRRPDKTLVMVTHYANELPPCIMRTKVLAKAE